MKVGILGSGDVAKALAGGFLRHGHQVMLGTRDAAKLKDFAAQHRRAQIGSFVDTAKIRRTGRARGQRHGGAGCT